MSRASRIRVSARLGWRRRGRGRGCGEHTSGVNPFGHIGMVRLEPFLAFLRRPAELAVLPTTLVSISCILIYFGEIQSAVS